MAMRNFWIECDIDGRKHRLHGGPRAADGGFVLRVYMRDRGRSREVVTIVGHALEDDLLSLRVDARDRTTIETTRR